MSIRREDSQSYRKVVLILSEIDVAKLKRTSVI
jgi:hypothetical protein